MCQKVKEFLTQPERPKGAKDEVICHVAFINTSAPAWKCQNKPTRSAAHICRYRVSKLTHLTGVRFRAISVTKQY